METIADPDQEPEEQLEVPDETSEVEVEDDLVPGNTEAAASEVPLPPPGLPPSEQREEPEQTEESVGEGEEGVAVSGEGKGTRRDSPVSWSRRDT